VCQASQDAGDVVALEQEPFSLFSIIAAFHFVEGYDDPIGALDEKLPNGTEEWLIVLPESFNRTCFAGKALGELRIGHFDRHIPIQPGVMRAIHFAHPAFTDGREDFIRAEFIAGRDRHLCVRAKFSRSESG
jgi:hypothetical protein